MTERIRSALSHIPADDREQWVMLGMAVKSELGDAGFEAWDAWSQTADNYRPDSAKAVWRSIKAGGGISVASLFKAAIDCGWRDDGAHRQPTSQELAARRQEVQARAAEEERETARRHAAAARRAQALVSTATSAEHPYLKSKGLAEVFGMVLPDGELLVPMRDWKSNELIGAQVIRLMNNEWEKKMLPGQRARGAVLRLGPKNALESVLVEGFADGLSIEAASKMMRFSMAVIVCFSAGNLGHVANLLPGKRFIFADNDQSRTGEETAIKTGLPYCMSEIVGEDVNDLHQRAGLMAVAQKLMELRMMR